MAQYINKDTYVGDTGKQLNDIKTNADNIQNNSTDIQALYKAIEDLKPVELYNNSSGDMFDEYTLSQSSANFKRLTIYYRQTSYFGSSESSVEVLNPNGKNVLLFFHFPLDTYNNSTYYGAYSLSRVFKISTNKIILLNADNRKIVGWNNTGTWGLADSIRITRVVGWKY